MKVQKGNYSMKRCNICNQEFSEQMYQQFGHRSGKNSEIRGVLDGNVQNEV